MIEEHGIIYFTYSHNFVAQKLLIYWIICWILIYTYYCIFMWEGIIMINSSMHFPILSLKLERCLFPQLLFLKSVQ
jgi:hypothetical protein